MNLRGGWALVQRLWLSYMGSRGFFWTLALGWMMGPLVYMFVWVTASRQGLVGGYSRDEFIVYYLTMMLVNQLSYPVSNWTVGDVIRMGLFSSWLLRPLPPIYEAIGTDVATKMICMPFTAAIVILLGLALRPAISFSLQDVFLFIIALLLAMGLRFLFAYALALLALWSSRADALLGLNDTLIFLFAGQVAPTALLPGVLRTVANLMPFRYMMGFPIEVLMGRLSQAELLAGFGGQAAWLIIVFVLYRLVWRSGVRNYSAVGG